MADNYLERQYERYEARKAAWEKARKLGLGRRPAAKRAQPAPRTAGQEEGGRGAGEEE